MHRDHVAYTNRITRQRRLTPRDKERLHSEGFSAWLNEYVCITHFYNDIALHLLYLSILIICLI